jgi:hypothetical protein
MMYGVELWGRITSPSTDDGLEKLGEIGLSPFLAVDMYDIE